jgi:hypothetical protein
LPHQAEQNDSPSAHNVMAADAAVFTVEGCVVGQ